MSISKPTVVELFAGAGFFGFGFRSVGFKIAKAIEIDPVAAATYALNMGNGIQIADVCRVVPTGRCDVIIAGPPCQGFSTLGSRDSADPRNRLALKVLGWVEVARPRVVVIENVPQFLQSIAAKKLRRQLLKLNYQIHEFILDAACYGVPQHRRRAFFLAHRSKQNYAIPDIAGSITTVREAFKGLPAKADGKNLHYAPVPSEVALARMRVIPPGGDKRDIMRNAPNLAAPSWWRIPTQVTDVWGRMAWDRPSNTLRTCLQNASKGRYIHPVENRVISLREAARLQTIPDDWLFEGTATQVSRQIGNGVPPLLSIAVATSVRNLL